MTYRPCCITYRFLLIFYAITCVRSSVYCIFNSCQINFIDTSRPVRAGEVDGKEYHFVTREKIEEDINAGKMLKYGEYKGNLYGTSSESVQTLVSGGYICVLNPHYQVRTDCGFI